ncbi:hypothetical protein GN956_G12420 [Arapaima gigas]
MQTLNPPRRSDAMEYKTQPAVSFPRTFTYLLDSFARHIIVAVTSDHDSWNVWRVRWGEEAPHKRRRLPEEELQSLVLLLPALTYNYWLLVSLRLFIDC